MAHTLDAFLTKYRSLIKKGNDTLLQRMLLLVELKPNIIIWHSSRYTSWEQFLTGERLCSTNFFREFDAATKAFKPSLIKRIGAECAGILVRVEEPLRLHMLNFIDAHLKAHGVPPTRWVLWRYVRVLRDTPLPRGVSAHVRH